MLEPKPLDYIDNLVAGMGFEVEERAEKIPMGLDAKESFANCTKIEICKIQLRLR